MCLSQYIIKVLAISCRWFFQFFSQSY